MGIKRNYDFSIEALLTDSTEKRLKMMSVKVERPESPSSTTSPPPSWSPSVSPSVFPSWTQCQRDSKKSRRPYSRQTVTILSWWFHHLPFLTVEEMEVVGSVTQLSRQQVKVWWQNRRHSQRGRQTGETDPYLSHILHLPTASCLGNIPEPGNGYRHSVFRDILNFYLSTVIHLIVPPASLY